MCNSHNCNHNYLHIEDNSLLVKDIRSDAVISIDDAGYKAALNRKKKAKKMEKMEEDISELKTMMATLIQKLDK